MIKIYSHGNCDFYDPLWDECKKFYESNMSRRVRLCECPMRNGDDGMTELAMYFYRKIDEIITQIDDYAEKLKGDVE